MSLEGPDEIEPLIISMTPLYDDMYSSYSEMS